MVFSSFSFLLLFLPLVLAGYFAIHFLTRLSASRNRAKFGWRWCNLFLLLSSLFFYFWGEGYGVCFLLLSVFVNDVMARAIAKSRAISWRRFFLTVDVVFNLLFLGFFKYADFLIETVNLVPGLSIPLPHILLPLGISFYTFQAMSYVIDVYRREVAPAKNPLDFACYVTLFPQLVAGPIVRYRQIADELVDRSLTWERLASGFRRFLRGLAKKVLIANVAGDLADKVWCCIHQGQGVSPVFAWIAVLAYTLQIYYDFSGYSDMAIGLGRIFGFDFLENFKYPYAALGIRDFWRRWHISLSTWFRDYLYIPLGGNRCSKLRTAFNGLVVFALCGLWHGAGVMFILWGLWHGLFLMLERFLVPRSSSPEGKQCRMTPALCLKRLLAHLYTFAVFGFGWMLFRSENFADLGFLLRCMGGDIPVENASRLLWIDLSPHFWLVLATGVLFSFPVAGKIRSTAARFMAPQTQYALECVVLLLLGYLSFISLATGTYNPFIYFRF